MRKKSSAFALRMTKSKFTNPVTLTVYPRSVQEQLRDALASRESVKLAEAVKKGQKDPYQYWMTHSQALRSFNTAPRFGEEPARVTGGATKVVPLSSLQEAEETFLMQSHPPHFFSGVGIYVDGKWHKLQSGPMIKALNPKRDTRALFIDVDTCEDSGFTTGASPITLNGIADRVLFCADQMEHPGRVFPTRGLALNPTTARRFTQPAHDVLVTAALLRGFVSPFWLTESQITRFYRVALKPSSVPDFVEVPGRVSVLLKFAALPKDQQKRIVDAFPLPEQREREGLVVALDGGNWEVVVHQTVLQEMEKRCSDSAPSSSSSSSSSGGGHEIDLWVSLSSMRFLFEDWWKGAKYFHFLNCPADGDAAKELAHFLDSTVGRRNWIDQCKITKMKLYNAEATTNPRLILPQTRNVALCGGRPIHNRYLSTVTKHAFENNYLSPIWLTPFDVLKVPGLAVKPNEKPLELSEKAQLRDLLFNIDDLEPESVKRCLAKYPAPPPEEAKNKHFSLALTWHTVLSVSRQRFLTGLKRERNLWVPHKEVVLNSYKLKPGTKSIHVMTGQSGSQSDRAKARGSDSVRKLFNAEQTTDPVRVTALALMKLL
jgi:hypothetical protein